MTNVVNLSDRRKPPAPGDIIKRCYEEVQVDWKEFKERGELDNYFKYNALSYINEKHNYLSDLNAIRQAEITIGMIIGVECQELEGNQVWHSTFVIKGLKMHSLAAPNEMEARCIGILLFLRLSRELNQIKWN
jgi:hypothetical protein